jgi:predicted DNA-binding transcriptional regulator YafY
MGCLMKTNSGPHAPPERFGSGASERPAGEASKAAARKLAMLIELVVHRQLRFSQYTAHYGEAKRSFQRDLQQLRQIAGASGFAISPIRDGELVTLTDAGGKVRKLSKSVGRADRLIASAARALGEPIAREIAEAASLEQPDDFFNFVTPQLVDGSSVADTCSVLRSAQSAQPGRAIVRFAYLGADGKKAEREVEPYRVTVRSGAFFLVGYDRGRRAWRTFALDRFASKPAKIGTATAVRTIPTTYASDDVIGFIKGSAQSSVTVELESNVAQAAIARRWQTAQKVEKLPRGRGRITFTVSDPSEVVRWALGFGADAQVVSPPEAVACARAIVASISARYATA